MNELQIFSFRDAQVRMLLISGEPWWVAKDVCDVLDLDNVSQALSGLDDDEKNTVSIPDGNRGNPNMAIVNEAGLYSLVLRSRKPEAKAFKRWITHEVLPAIRKTGTYSVGQLPGAEQPKLLSAAQQEREAAAIVRSRMAAARALHVDENQAKLSAMKTALLKTGIDYKADFNLTNTLVAPVQTRYLTPTEIGQRLHPNRNGRQINQLLLGKGFQEEIRDDEGHLKGYRGSDAGSPHWILVDEARQNAGGNIQTLRWYESVVPILQALVSAAVEA